MGQGSYAPAVVRRKEVENMTAPSAAAYRSKPDTAAQGFVSPSNPPGARIRVDEEAGDHGLARAAVAGEPCHATTARARVNIP
ncbi:hypothetical protein GCM10020220_005260 [Nonomuraea rubra]